MLIPILALLALQQTGTPPASPPPAAPVQAKQKAQSDSFGTALGDSLRRMIDEARKHARDVDSASRRSPSAERRAPRTRSHTLVPVTPALLATAFATPAARTLLARVRQARLSQDLMLRSYDATTYERISAGMGLKHFARDRLLFRSETATRVVWNRGTGAYIDVLGARAVAPAVGGDADVDANGTPDLANVVSPVPYFPGQENLIIDAGHLARRSIADEDPEGIIHPLAEGSEAYYRYSVGDSSSMRLPDGKVIRLVELRAEPRHPRWNLLSASFWFDAASGHLARAFYRFSVPMDIWQVAAEDGDDDDAPAWVKGMLSPMEFDLGAVVEEYALYQEQWWLPRLRELKGEAQVSFMRFPISFQQRFEYASVNGLDTLPTGMVARLAEVEAKHQAEEDVAQRAHALRVRRDSARRAGDTLAVAAYRDSLRALRDTLRDSLSISVHLGEKAHRPSACDTAPVRWRTRTAFGGALPMMIRIPCDTAALAHSAALPPSIYDPGERVFGKDELDALMAQFDAVVPQPGFHPARPTFRYGLPLTRFNRVEGLSSGIRAEEQLGAGWTADGVVRLGLADLVPNAELAAQRHWTARTVGIGVYRRLAAANDWGNPLDFGASMGALLFGHDDGLYYRTEGAELTGTGTTGSTVLDWRAFVERQGDAAVRTQFSLPHALWGGAFGPNIVAERGTSMGVAARLLDSRGLDPHDWRLTTELRAEAAGLDWVYTRGAADLVLSHEVGPWLDASLGAGAGSSTGDVPVQRLFYLGGTRSVRGEPAASAAGTAYWLAHAELGTHAVTFRPVLFTDIGWAGDRHDWRHVGRPVSGVGIGASMLDGMLRFDVSRGIWPAKAGRVDLYVEGRF